ncbi:MAG: hypothetical protein R3D59_01375 [Paracoccaceae bacterium]
MSETQLIVGPFNRVEGDRRSGSKSRRPESRRPANSPMFRG